MVQISLFRSMDSSMLHSLALRLEPKYYASDEIIVKKGLFLFFSLLFPRWPVRLAILSHIWPRKIPFLIWHQVSVTSPDGETVFAEMNEGAFFGEVGVLFDLPRTGNRFHQYDIAAHIRTDCPCETLILKKSDLDEVLQFNPIVEAKVCQIAGVTKQIRDCGSERYELFRARSKDSENLDLVVETICEKLGEVFRFALTQHRLSFLKCALKTCSEKWRQIWNR